MAELVSSVEELVSQIERYNDDAGKLADLIPFCRAWYALPTTDGYRFGPSKFVGYVISADEYLASPYSPARHGRVQRDNSAPPLDGRDTERVLRRLADPVAQGKPGYDDLHAALTRFCERYGKKPNRLARIAVVRT